VATSALTDPNETHVGYTVVFSDVTERERRRQQLEVLNRILRHNLRNDAGVVAGYGELLVERLDNPELVQMADAIGRRAGALAALGEKAGTVESLLSDADRNRVAVDELVESVVADARKREPDATIELALGDGDGRSTGTTESAGDPDWTADLRSDALRAIVENTVENALDHHDGEGVEREDGGSWVRVGLRREGASEIGADGGYGDTEGDGAAGERGERDGRRARFVFTVADDGPGIPDQERERGRIRTRDGARTRLRARDVGRRVGCRRPGRRGRLRGS